MANLATSSMTVVTTVSLRHLSGELVRYLMIADGGRLGRIFTSFSCSCPVDRQFAKVLILSRTRLESALASPRGTKESCVSQDFEDRICRVRY